MKDVKKRPKELNEFCIGEKKIKKKNTDDIHNDSPKDNRIRVITENC